MSWIDKLKSRWGVESTFRIVMILIVFTCTGFTVLFLKKPLFNFLGFDAENLPLYVSIIYYILILPVYMAFLLFYGFIFGQYSFFRAFVKKSFSRLKRK
ncbi:prolipoprotein diacylglyceryl transferase [Hyphobacterium sp. CCMP332]|nr:prolipoprotein diacylglyceryl transferase [Hyphobacterium sp. CCMP332]